MFDQIDRDLNSGSLGKLMQVKKVNGVHIHYAEMGNPEGQPFVFSNSLGTDFRIWHNLLPLLGDDYRFVLYDKRGHGLSECPPEPYQIEDHVGDLEQLMHSLDVSNAIVCGLSVGGLIAQGVSALCPDRIQRLILCDTAHIIGPPELWDDRLNIIRSSGIASLEAPILERWFSSDFRTNRVAELAAWRAMLVRTPEDGYIGTGMAIRNADMTEAAKNIKVPTLCLVGSDDGATPPDLVKSMADLIPGAHFQIVAGAGHLPCIEQPRQMADYILNFIMETEHGK